MIILGITASSDKNAPSAPTIGTATNVGTGRAYNNGRADVTFTAPTYTGGSDIVSYTVTSSPGGFTGTGSASPISVTGLQSNTAYTFTVTATNAAGFTSPASAASNSITATTVPQAPTIGTATAGDASASVTFTANATGGSAITSFTATSSPGSITGTAASSPITVSGLTNGTAYTFTVTATNANGTSTASAASNSVTPIASGDFFTLATLTATGGETTLVLSSISQSYTHLLCRISATVTTTGQTLMRTNSTYSFGQVLVYGYNQGSQLGVVHRTTVSTLYIDRYGTNSQSADTQVSEFMIPYYAVANTEKNIFGMGGGNTTQAVNQETTLWTASTQNAENAVTSITFSRVNGAFQAGTRVTLYGIV